MFRVTIGPNIWQFDLNEKTTHNNQSDMANGFKSTEHNFVLHNIYLAEDTCKCNDQHAQL